MDPHNLRHFELRLLRYFSVLADELHFGRAAARLSMSQPPLSQQIRVLEEKIGAPLFDRNRHGVALTPAGQTLKEQVPFVFTQLAHAIDLTRKTARGQHGKLEIGTVSSAMVQLIPEGLRVFSGRYPQVSWTLHEMPPPAQLQALREQRIDVCLFRMKHNDTDLASEVLLYEPIVAALPATHPLCRKPDLNLKDLAGDPFILFRLGQSRLADFLYQCCLQAGFSPTIQQQVFEVQTVLSLVAAKLGVALLPASTQQLVPAGVVFKRLAPPLPEVPLYVVYRANDISPVVPLFLETLRGLVEHDYGPSGTSEPVNEERIEKVFTAREP